jgi:hypothetical protein
MRTIFCESEEVIHEMIPTRNAEKQRRVGRLMEGKGMMIKFVVRPRGPSKMIRKG